MEASLGWMERFRARLADPAVNAKAWYLLSFAASVAVGPFLNLYFQQLGLTHSQVSGSGAERGGSPDRP